MSHMPGAIASGGVSLPPQIGKGKIRKPAQPVGVSQRETQREDFSATETQTLSDMVRQVLGQRQVVRPYTPPKGVYIGKAFQTTKPGPKFMVDRGLVDCFTPGSVITLDDLREYRQKDPQRIAQGLEEDIDTQHLLDHGFLLPVAETAQAHEKVETFIPQTAVPSVEAPQPQ